MNQPIAPFNTAQRLTQICVAVDSSGDADSVTDLAIALAIDTPRSELSFCHVIDVQRIIARADRAVDDYGRCFESAQDTATAILARCCVRARSASIAARSFIRLGNPAEEMQALARLSGAELLIIGNSPATRLHRLFNGSVRDDLARTSNLPVLVATRSGAARPFAPRCVLVAGDKSPSNLGVERLAMAVAGNELSHLIFVPLSRDEQRSDARRIDDAVAEHRPGLVVIPGEHGRRPANIFRNDVLERMLQRAEIPVLISAP